MCRYQLVKSWASTHHTCRNTRSKKRRQMTIKKTKKSHTNAQRSKSAETSRDQESRPFAIAEGSAKRMIIQPCQGRKNFKTPPSHNTPCRERHWLNWSIWGFAALHASKREKRKKPILLILWRRPGSWERENRLLLPRKAAAIRAKKVACAVVGKVRARPRVLFSSIDMNRWDNPNTRVVKRGCDHKEL